MKNYLLIHGAWGGAWEFNEVVQHLSADGSNVKAIDLPGHGNNTLPVSEVTMASYVETVIEAINKMDGKVILVGHSLAGAIISQVAEAISEQIERLIYVAAILPVTGDSPLALMESDEDGELLKNVIFSEDMSIATLRNQDVRNLLLNDVTDKARLDSLVPHFLMEQSTEPFMAVSKLSDEKFGSVAKYYIRASIDKVLSPALQERMLTNWNVEAVRTLESGHFPLTSMAEALSDTIRELS